MNTPLKIDERYKCQYGECSNQCPLYHPDAKLCLQHFAINYAKEQRKIDIEKACECFRQELKHFVRFLECLKEGSSEIIDIEGSIDSFRKAMEE